MNESPIALLRKLSRSDNTTTPCSMKTDRVVAPKRVNGVVIGGTSIAPAQINNAAKAISCNFSNGPKAGSYSCLP
ncbi:hypothetical protein SAMN03080618_01559 [Aquamicrobium aerolatum DSM 21857]|uniref:Uncharacterized protein n=1 Tax=Aquamicrobium aerolatum DSM 21857 TaxID=1121003 RepID=A0A1I3LNH4_9HYPH|nr:hypothetical protein SAMN03080618_01559 [Aquamicrobium aerolatum DSM 21857]